MRFWKAYLGGMLLLAAAALLISIAVGAENEDGSSPEIVDSVVEDVNLDDVKFCEETGACNAGDLYGGDGARSAGQDSNNLVRTKVEACVDDHEKCPTWAENGECDISPKFMLKTCKKSCKVCGDVEHDLGVEQIIDRKTADECRARIAAAKDYLRIIAKDPELRHVLAACKLHHPNCAFWSAVGECTNSAGYMNKNCAPVCGTCDQLSRKQHCFADDVDETTNAWKPGDLNKFFTNITTLKEYKQYEPNVLSRPSYLAGDSEKNAGYEIGPWVVVLENVVTKKEADRLIELGAAEGFQRSTDVGKLKSDGSFDSQISEGRTSTNAWCVKGCYKDKVAQRVIQRVTDITKIPEVNSEYLQIVKYEAGQYYSSHHDYTAHLRDRPAGVRLITIVLYLNDLDDLSQGGGTNFPELGITVQPKLGRALIYPSVADQDPSAKDRRTTNQDLPVFHGVKYAAIAWIHQRDFKTPNKEGCN